MLTKAQYIYLALIRPLISTLLHKFYYTYKIITLLYPGISIKFEVGSWFELRDADCCKKV